MEVQITRGRPPSLSCTQENRTSNFKTFQYIRRGEGVLLQTMVVLGVTINYIRRSEMIWESAVQTVQLTLGFHGPT